MQQLLLQLLRHSWRPQQQQQHRCYRARQPAQPHFQTATMSAAFAASWLALLLPLLARLAAAAAAAGCWLQGPLLALLLLLCLQADLLAAQTV
jgi:hypothetical protein